MPQATSTAFLDVPKSLHRMWMEGATVLAVGLLAGGCGPEREGSSPPTDEWVAEAVASPEYVTACQETPGCDPTPAAPGSTEPVWRARVVRQPDGAFRIEDLARVEVMADAGVPLGALYSEFALVGIDSDGAVVDGQAIRFPTHVRVEYEGSQPVQEIDLAGQEVDAIGFVRALPEIVSLAVQDSAGEILQRIDAPGSEEHAWLPNPLRLLAVEEAYAAASATQGLPPSCAHVIILRGESQRRLAGGMQWEQSITLVEPGPYQLAATQAALERMTPMLCQGVRRIAFGHVPASVVSGGITGAVASASAGDMVVINVAGLVHETHLQQMISRRLLLQKSVTHEAGHAAETLLTFESSNPGNYTGAWAFPARSLASETIENVRLEVGLEQEWRRMHESFLQQGWARPYGSFPKSPDPVEGEPPPPPVSWRPDDVVDGGFMSRYSSTWWAEDVADFVAWAYLSRPYTDAYAEHGVSDDAREDFGCLIMREYGERDLPSRYAAVYTKLHFLKDLGLVRPEDVDDCAGAALGLHIDGAGFQVWQDGELRRTYDRNLEASLGTAPVGAKVFVMSAAGEAGFGEGTYPAEVRLQIGLGSIFTEFEKVSWPRGVYRLGLRGDTNFTIRLDGAPAGNFDAMDGFVLVTESSAERIAGSIVLQRVFRPSAPLPVPELYDPPLVVRLLIEKEGLPG